MARHRGDGRARDALDRGRRSRGRDRLARRASRRRRATSAAALRRTHRRIAGGLGSAAQARTCAQDAARKRRARCGHCARRGLRVRATFQRVFPKCVRDRSQRDAQETLMKLETAKVKTPVGTLRLAAKDGSLVALAFDWDDAEAWLTRRFGEWQSKEGKDPAGAVK